MSKRTEIDGVQLLRAIAVLLVVLDHVEGMFAMPKYFGILFAGGFFSAGTVGVDLFFVISGFIITYVTEGLDTKRNSPRAFAIRRFCRIIPFLWLCVMTHYLTRALSVGNIDFMPYGRAILLYPVGTVSPSQVWTLRHEVFFYLMVAISLYGRRFLPILAVFLALPILWALVDSAYAQAPEGRDWFTGLFNLRANTAFGTGLIVGLAFRNKITIKYRSWLNWALIIAAPVLLLVMAHLISKSIILTPIYSTLIVDCICAICLLVSLTITVQTLIERSLMLIGSASYSIYLTHDAAISASGIILTRMHMESILISVMLTIVTCILVGIAIHLSIERWMVRVSRRLLENSSEDNRS